MMMPAVLKVIACMGYAHVAQTEAAPKRAFNRRIILRPHKVENGILWRGLSLCDSGKGRRCYYYGQRE